MKKKKNKVIPSIPELEEERRRLAYRSLFSSTVRKVVFSLLAVAAASAILATLFFPVLEVAGSSMEPVLVDGDIIMLYNTRVYKTGDLCGFYWQNKLLLKRVIGTPGDTVSLDAAGNVYLNGSLLDEPYVSAFELGECDVDFPCTVPAGSYFVLGDHRSTSIDSRSSAIGCIPTEQIIGKVFLRVWPAERISLF